MIQYIIPLISSFLDPDFLNYWFYPLFALAFLVTFPRIVRRFIER